MKHAPHSEIQTIEATDTSTQIRLDDLCEVILFNDDVNAMEHVVESLMNVFHHPEQLAVKIMIEAHRNGNAIAEVEERSQAQLHKDQLQSLGLTAEIRGVE